MINFKRAKPFPSGTTSPMNKGILVTAGASATSLSLTCLDPNGDVTGVTGAVPANSSTFFPLYVRSWTGTNTPSVCELN